MKRILLLFIATLACTFSMAQDKKLLTFDDYSSWNRISRANISPNGVWVAYGLTPNGGDDTLFIKNLETDTVYKVEFADNPQFSDDNQWAIYTLSPSKKEAKKLRDARKEVTNKTVLLHLESGKKQVFDRINRAQFTNNGHHLAIHRKKHADDKSTHSGSDLILKDLKNNRLLNLGNVSDFAFNQSGSWLAYLVDADQRVGNGLYGVDLASYQIQALDTDTLTYSQLAWDDAQAHKNDWNKKGKNLAALKGIEASGDTYRENVLLVVRNLGTNNFKIESQNTSSWSGFPENMVLSENGNLRWSDDGNTLFFGIREQEEKLKLSRDTIPNVDVWHWKDEMIQTVQIRRANMLRRYTYLSALHLDKNAFVRLADDDFRQVMTSKHPQYGIARNDRSYITDVSWGESPADLYRIDYHSGERKQFASNISRALGMSPDGKNYLYFDGEHIFAYDLEKDHVTNVSSSAGVSFGDEDHPYPNAQPSYGYAGWTKDGKGVIVNHKFDLWLLSLDGKKAQNLTAGLGDREEIRFRYVSLDPWEEYIDLKTDLLLSAYGEWTKKTGYYKVKSGQNPQEIVYQDRNFGRPLKAENADRVLYTVQTFVDFPDYYVSGGDFQQPRRVTDANPQQKDFAWGERILVEFTNSKGQKLQGTLALPAGYEPGKKYPMIVYFYEKMSQNHHVYSMPVYDDRPHMSYYASNGYLVLQPDIVYDEGYPGTSSLDCITSAVQQVIDLGYADPAKIGLQGHSWGGYQSSFILTQTDMFACVVTGAPPTNLESFYNNLYGSTGTNHHGITEIGQIRMGRNVTPWSNREAYQRENPTFHADKITTPFMILHGTVDGAVDWAQGMEFYNATRRLGKEVIFLSYPGEDHHLANEANAKDFQKRMAEYFDHYLKGTEAPEWMVSGIPNLQKLYDKAR